MGAPAPTRYGVASVLTRRATNFSLPLIPLLLAIAAFTLQSTGCQGLGQTLTAVDQGLYEAVPTHPVTGLPMANLVSEEKEIRVAQARWKKLATAARREGILVDPPGPRLQQISRVFSVLLSVAHRQGLPWQVHLFRHPKVNAATLGGGQCEIDALTNGFDQIVPVSSPGFFAEVRYSVDRASVGAGGSVIATEATVPPNNGAAGDVFRIVIPAGFPPGVPVLDEDSTFLFLTPAPTVAGQTDLDALSNAASIVFNQAKRSGMILVLTKFRYSQYRD